MSHMTDIQRQFSEVVVRELEKLELSPRRLAKRCNYGPQTVSRVLSGKNSGSLHLWQSLFDELGMELIVGVKIKHLTEEQLEVARHDKNTN